MYRFATRRIEQRPTRHSIVHFGGGLHSQSLGCYSYWQTNNKLKKTEYKSHQYTHKQNTNQQNTNTVTSKHTAETKLPRFSRILWHSARKRGWLILQWPRAPHISLQTQLSRHTRAARNDTVYCCAITEAIKVQLDDDQSMTIYLHSPYYIQNLILHLHPHIRLSYRALKYCSTGNIKHLIH